jgi:hypothetical protein
MTQHTDSTGDAGSMHTSELANLQPDHAVTKTVTAPSDTENRYQPAGATIASGPALSSKPETIAPQASISREQLERCRELGLTPVPGKHEGRDKGGTFRSLEAPVDALSDDERADIDRQHEALLADLGPSPSASDVILCGQIRDALADIVRLRKDVDRNGAFARNGRRLRSAFAAVAAAQERITVLLKLLKPAKSSGRKRVADPAAAVAAFNAAIDARKR